MSTNAAPPCEMCAKAASWSLADRHGKLRYACMSELGELLAYIGSHGEYPRSGRFEITPIYPWHTSSVQPPERDDELNRTDDAGLIGYGPTDGFLPGAVSE